MKTFRLFSMAALALAMAACSNNDDNEILQNTQQPGTMHFTATIAAPSGDATTRTAYTEVGTQINVEWEVGDQIALVHNGKVDVAEVKTVDDVTGKATIEADITGTPSDNDDVYLAYPAVAVVSATPYSPLPFTPNPDIFDNVKNYQDGTLAYIQNNLDLRMGSGKLAVNGSDVSLKESVSVSSLICIWKLTLQDESSNALSATQLTFKNNTYTQAKATSAAKSVYYLCVVPSFIPDASGTFSFEATVGSDTYTFSKTGLSLTAGKYYQSTVTMAKPDLLSGVFSVSDSKKVSFSKGNLQATYDGSNWTWAFAANQWDYIGNAAGNTMVTATSPFISGNATVDLFGWVGASSNWTGVNKYGITSSSATNDKDGYGNVPDETLMSDWGTLIGSGWRTLTMDEWTYLLSTRTVNGGTGEDKSYTLNKTVNGKRCLVLYPDNYTGAVYSGSNWASFEAAGCVFLPAAGWRNGTTINNTNDRGFYWSTTPSNATAAKRLFFAASLELPPGDNSRAYGFSVRLVREVE